MQAVYHLVLAFSNEKRPQLLTDLSLKRDLETEISYRC